MIQLSPYGKPLAQRTSDSDATSMLVPWDVATVAALKAIESIDGLSTSSRPRYMTLPQGRIECVRSSGCPTLARRAWGSPPCTFDRIGRPMRRSSMKR